MTTTPSASLSMAGGVARMGRAGEARPTPTADSTALRPRAPAPRGGQGRAPNRDSLRGRGGRAGHKGGLAGGGGGGGLIMSLRAGGGEGAGGGAPAGARGGGGGDAPRWGGGRQGGVFLAPPGAARLSFPDAATAIELST